MKSLQDAKIALVTPGGGARAAYEVGVLKLIRELTGQSSHSPFSIYCGISCGAFNAASLALAADHFSDAVADLEQFWSSVKADDIYRAGSWAMPQAAFKWLLATLTGGRRGSTLNGLLDTQPLEQLLEKRLDFERLESLIANHSLLALSITCSGYASGQCVSFFQGRADLEPWQRTQRVGAHVPLTARHVQASMAVPFLFSAVKLHREYFGDGAMRELSPLSPAVNLGASRIMVIGGGRMAIGDGDRSSSDRYPSASETAGHVLSGLYADSLSADIERMEQINRLMSQVPPESAEGADLPWRPIELLVVEPSQRLDLLAASMADELPAGARRLVRSLGVSADVGGAFASYLLFEQAYTARLVALGYQDASDRRQEIADFLKLDIS